MPKRVIDFDAMWASDKLAACAEWAQAEYAWLYGLADASGSFELTNLRVIWGRVAAIRRNLTLERLEQIFAEFISRGLLFTWEENGKRYGHWTGSDVPGRLPPPSWRARLERLAPPVPRAALAEYASRFGGRQAALARAAAAHLAGAPAPEAQQAPAGTAGLKRGLEPPQAQDLDWELDLEREKEQKQVCAPAVLAPRTPEDIGVQPPRCVNSAEGERWPAHWEAAGEPAEALRKIYSEERGSLPPAERLTPERQRQCALRLAAGLSLEDFRLAVRRAASTPFLAGGGERGWRASFDWFIADDTNVRKVLEGRYDSGYEPGGVADARHSAWNRGDRSVARFLRDAATAAELRAGSGPNAAACGARLSAAALERIRAQQSNRGEAAASPPSRPGLSQSGVA